MSDRFEYDVYLCYSHKDRPRAQELAMMLKEAGLDVWFDQWMIKAGDNVLLRIEQGLEESRTLVFCMSPSAFGSDWMNLERSTIIFRDPQNKDRRFIPLLLKDCDIPSAIRQFSFIDFRYSSSEAFAELYEACAGSSEIGTKTNVDWRILVSEKINTFNKEAYSIQAKRDPVDIIKKFRTRVIATIEEIRQICIMDPINWTSE